MSLMDCGRSLPLFQRLFFCLNHACNAFGRHSDAPVPSPPLPLPPNWRPLLRSASATRPLILPIPVQYSMIAARSFHALDCGGFGHATPASRDRPARAASTISMYCLALRSGIAFLPVFSAQAPTVPLPANRSTTVPPGGTLYSINGATIASGLLCLIDCVAVAAIRKDHVAH